jgi:hypothetical protein
VPKVSKQNAVVQVTENETAGDQREEEGGRATLLVQLSEANDES